MAATRGSGGVAGSYAEVREGMELSARWTYRVERQLGRGGFSAVVLARCLDRTGTDPDEPPEHVALKVIGVPDDEDPRSLLRQELSALLALRHDRIPRVWDWSVEPPLPFVAMQHFPAGSLEDVSSFVGRLDDEAAWQMLADLLSAVNAAHRASILHLDIKPGNVLLDGYGGYVLTDFGLSRGSLVSDEVVRHRTGTPGYQAPEQGDPFGVQVDTRSDLWGVGATVWALYTGVELSFPPPDLCEEEDEGAGLPPLSRFRPDHDPELETILASLLRRDPEERPGGAAEVLARVRARLAGTDAPGATLARASRGELSREEVDDVIDGLMDPLWASICRSTRLDLHFAHYGPDDLLGAEGEESYHTHVLLRGQVAVERGGRCIAVESREGTFLGEIATLTGSNRTASMRALGDVWTCTFNAAELERFVTCNPAVGIRLIRSLAHRLQQETDAARGTSPVRSGMTMPLMPVVTVPVPCPRDDEE